MTSISFIDGEWEELKRDWQDKTITIKQLCKKYNFNSNDFYNGIRDRLIEDTGFRRAKPNPVKRKRTIKNYYYEKGKYHVRKQIDGKSLNFGSYNSELIAKLVVSKLKETGWDKGELPRIREELNVESSAYRKAIDKNLYEVLFNDYVRCKYTVKEICELRGISHSTWVRYLKEIKRNTDFRRKIGRYTGNAPKYYSFHWDDMHYHIQRVIDGKYITFGKYGDEYTTKQVVEKLKECDRDKSQLQRIIEELEV